MHSPDTDPKHGSENSEVSQRQLKPIGFLVITRKIGEGIKIGTNEEQGYEIHCLVNKIKGDQVRLAIYAPKEVQIGRSALSDRKKLRDMGRRPQGRGSE